MLMLRHPQNHETPVMSGVVRLLVEWGAKVDLIHPEEQVLDLTRVKPEHDLYVLRSPSEMAMGLAGVLHAAGAAILNPYPIAALLQDRIATTGILAGAGIPVPQTFVTARPEVLADRLKEGPLVVKPHRGSAGRGIHVVWDGEELDDVPAYHGLLYAQRFIGIQGRVRRLYVISGQVFGVEHHWPARNHTEKMGTAFTVNDYLRQLALRCGEAFGLEVYGLHIVGEEEHTYVVDMHSFPSFRGVPDASLRLADYVYHACKKALNGDYAAGGGSAGSGAAIGGMSRSADGGMSRSADNGGIRVDPNGAGP